MTESAELNEVKQSAYFTTKAETLSFLSQSLNSAKILPLYFFEVDQWVNRRDSLLSDIRNLSWHNQKLVVRSSTTTEDSIDSSFAGCFSSVIGISGEAELVQAIEKVISSYQSSDLKHQVLIQPLLENVKIAGVAFGRDPNTNGPYVVINYDDSTGSTDSITAGTSAASKCFICHKSATAIADSFINNIITLLSELEHLYQTDLIDIEFAVTEEGTLYLFQARPLVIKAHAAIPQDTHCKIMDRIVNKIELGNKPTSISLRQTYGLWCYARLESSRNHRHKTRPLALSLYRELVTDSVWAYQRDNYGYNNLRSFPLLVDFEGLPYIDVRVSFNSFLPKGLPDELAERLVNYYVDRLICSPKLHDKVEFEIIFSCYTLDLHERLHILNQYGFSGDDCKTIASSLTELTNRIINNRDGLWKKDLEKINELEKRQTQLFNSSLDPISKMYWILEDCKRYGTLPFAGLARAGFIAVQLLKSFVSTGIINQEEYANFFSSLDTISSRISRDYANHSPEEFLQIYGHLRPGTYDILSMRYDETPENYFDFTNKTPVEKNKHESFSLSIPQLREIQAKIDADGLQLMY